MGYDIVKIMTILVIIIKMILIIMIILTIIIRTPESHLELHEYQAANVLMDST